MSGYLVHSAKGTTWEDHKYIRKDGNRYIYKISEKGGISSSTRRGAEEVAEGDKLKNEYSEVMNTGVVNGETLKKQYNSRVKAHQNVDYGAGGMPSNVANAIKKALDTEFRSIVVTSAYTKQKKG